MNETLTKVTTSTIPKSLLSMAAKKLLINGTWVNSASGKTFELGGPEIFTFKQLMQFTLDTIGRKRLLLPVPWTAAKILGSVLGLLPKALLTADQVELLKADCVVSEEALKEGRGLDSFGISPRSIQSIAPSYLYRFRKAGQFTAPKGIPE